MKKRTQKLLSVLLAAALTAGTFGTCFAGAEEVSDTFTFVSTEPNTLNMIESSSNLDDYVFYLTNAMLYRSIDGEVTAELCDSMEVSDDGCTYTYTIKEAYYTDGSQIVADDFVYYFVKHYITSSNYSYFAGGEDTYNNSLDTCEGVYSLDDSTFVVTLVQPTTAFDGLLEIYPLNQAFAEEKGDALGGTPDDLMYSGPYVLTEWVVGSYMTFVKNDSYINADTLFPTENLKMMVSTDSSTTYSMYLNGEVDAIISVNSDLSEMLGVENCTWYSSGNVWGLEFNTTGCTYTDGDGFTSRGDDVTALMQNENFRKALCYALDREAIASVLGSGQATNRYVASSVTGTTEGTAYVDEYELEEVAPLSGDTDAAKEYLQAALDELGYSDVSELPTITYLTFETDAQKLLAETAVSIWENDLGLTNITINLQPISSAVMSMVYMDFDIYLQQLSVNTDDELELLNYWITTGEVSDPAGFQASGVPASMASMHADEEYDALIADAYVDFDEESYFSKVAEAEQMLYSAYVYFPIQEGGSYFITQDYVEGYTYESTLDYGYSFANVVVYAH